MARRLFGIGSDKSAAVAPTVALSLFALIGAGGIAFDYARMASLDTELQNAADQAALAGATQLDQEAGAIDRATAAAQGLLANMTVMSNDGTGTGITVPGVFFYETKADAEAEVNEIDTTDPDADSDARFIRVAVTPRRADFALTPVVSAFSSGNLDAEAVAGLGTAICKVPPLMICNPEEAGTQLDFDADAHIGDGLRLVTVGGGPGGWAPGNFGYLDSNGGSNGAPGLREALGWNTPPGDCIAQTGVDTKPGATVSVTDALNTRFDIYDSNVSCPNGGACAASINSMKDVVRSFNAGTNGNGCRLHNAGWGDPTTPYQPTSATANLPTTITPSSMGHPRDKCHAVSESTAGYCTNPIGDGDWDRDAYFRTHYIRGDNTRWTSAEWQTNTGLGATPTRYEVYEWEIANSLTVVDGVTVNNFSPPGASGPAKIARPLPICSPAEGYGPGQVPGGSITDRRRISVAVINCVAESVNGAETNLPVIKWIDVFLVEPSRDRNSPGDTYYTHQGQLYAEIIGVTQTGAGATAGQVVRRDVPYLVK